MLFIGEISQSSSMVNCLIFKYIHALESFIFSVVVAKILNPGLGDICSLLFGILRVFVWIKFVSNDKISSPILSRFSNTIHVPDRTACVKIPDFQMNSPGTSPHIYVPMMFLLSIDESR